MVAKITTPGSINKALNYNEKKVQKGMAQCFYAGNFLKDASDLNFYEKLNHFKRFIALNTRAKTNTLHISLNFDPSENLTHEKLAQIATSYMDKIGFGTQPYLVYEHTDSGHPHIHIVTTSIQENGKRIVTQNIGRNQSQIARKEIENTFGLIKAEGKDKSQLKGEDSMPAQKIKYGKRDTKRSITNVLNRVINRYHYTSLPELNAVLKLYNLHADRGAEGSRMYRNEGLTYRVLDDAGNKIGVPIKASSIYFKPTLKCLQEQFKKGEAARVPFKQKLKTAIDWTLHQKCESMAHFTGRLSKEKITVDLRKNKEGFIYGITFIDYRTACVFNGSDIGKEYSAAGIQRRITEGFQETLLPERNLLEKRQAPTASNEKLLSKKEGAEKAKTINTNDQSKEMPGKSAELLNDLWRADKGISNIPYEFRRKKKKKRGFNL